MKILIRSLNRNPLYFTGYLISAFILSLFCFFVPKSEGFLLVNQYHCKWFDYFFILFTNLGNGLFAIALMVFMLIRKKIGWSVQIGVSFLLSGLIVQILKHLIHSPRPKLYFGSGNIHCIYGITGTGLFSFPSGHAATIFALTTLLAIYFPGRRSGMFFILIAVVAGFSRIYLSQHFPIDVLAGSAIGAVISMVVYIFIPLQFFEKKFPENKWEHQSVKLR
jgi:membrane-associated phospholipid phosphatase